MPGATGGRNVFTCRVFAPTQPHADSDHAECLRVDCDVNYDLIAHSQSLGGDECTSYVTINQIVVKRPTPACKYTYGTSRLAGCCR